ncbi:Xaa-His dipeptidase [Sulfurospirillum sp. 1612]|uniref:Xaa-His dipeptidase n=1 Tax=Sulfurospirillum sp. 1612 TaxID=3094835 RepID=UPI002F9402D5
MNSVLDYFKIISKIPRCSFKTEKMRAFLVEEGERLGCEVSTDKAGNVLYKKGTPKICLQSHYDMVCIGKAPHLELIQEGNILRAKDSTLGADNGMGVCMMLYCMQKYENLECLFTSDEEVGLIGATELELPIVAPYVLNLDGEDENEIYTGCAGGTDMEAVIDLKYEDLSPDATVYEAKVVGLKGGHSGVEIDKNIASSIKVMARFLSQCNGELIHLEAGERRNSIAKHAKAIFTSSERVQSDDEHIVITEIKNTFSKKIENSQAIIKTLQAFPQGVRSWNREYGIPEDSINLGLVEMSETQLKVILSLRFLNDKNSAILADETRVFFELCGFSASILSTHVAWTPTIGEFSHTVKDIVSKYVPGAQFKAIHAGLECGILLSNCAQVKEAISIGPNIRSPHSTREECDLDSVERITQAVEEIIAL